MMMGCGVTLIIAAWLCLVALRVADLKRRGSEAMQMWPEERRQAYARHKIAVPLLPLLINPLREDVNPYLVVDGFGFGEVSRELEIDLDGER